MPLSNLLDTEWKLICHCQFHFPIAHRTRNDVLVSETQPWVLLVMRLSVRQSYRHCISTNQLKASPQREVLSFMRPKQRAFGVPARSLEKVYTGESWQQLCYPNTWQLNPVDPTRRGKRTRCFSDLFDLNQLSLLENLTLVIYISTRFSSSSPSWSVGLCYPFGSYDNLSMGGRVYQP